MPVYRRLFYKQEQHPQNLCCVMLYIGVCYRMAPLLSLKCMKALSWRVDIYHVSHQNGEHIEAVTLWLRCISIQQKLNPTLQLLSSPYTRWYVNIFFAIYAIILQLSFMICLLLMYIFKKYILRLCCISNTIFIHSFYI